MKRKLLIIFTVCLLVLGLAACSSNKNESESQTNTEKTTNNHTTETGSETEKANTNAKSAVIYFSATGTTKGVAEVLASETGSDLIEIVPLKPYDSADLTYSKECRANAEQKDANARPEIQNDLSVATEYDVIYLGYPIWWGTNPRIIQTFLEKYDLSGAKIYLFCTSGGTGIETSVNDIKTQYKSLNIVDGKRFSSADKNEIDQWINK